MQIHLILNQNSFGKFVQELRNRRVFRVTAVYLGTGYVILEASDMIFLRLGLPDWIVTFVMILLGLGFPLAAGLAWTFQVTPEGIKRSPKSGEQQSTEYRQPGNYRITGADPGGLNLSPFFWPFEQRWRSR